MVARASRGRSELTGWHILTRKPSADASARFPQRQPHLHAGDLASLVGHEASSTQQGAAVVEPVGTAGAEPRGDHPRGDRPASPSG